MAQKKNDKNIKLSIAIYDENYNQIDSTETSLSLTNIEKIISVASELILNKRDQVDLTKVLNLLEDSLETAQII